jgi:hypothetical protein
MFNSILRGLPRIALLSLIGAASLLFAHLPTLLGATGGPMPVLAPLAFGGGLVFLSLAAGDLALRILQPAVDTQLTASQATRQNSVGAGLVYLGRCILAAAVMVLMVTAARADQPPPAAIPLLPVLQAQIGTYWPDMPVRSALGAQVEQETCISLRHRMCWNPRAELKTSREQGIGLGQLTRTWDKAGNQRFDALGEIVASFPRDLEGLSWENRYDPELQLRALVLKDRQGYRMVHGAATGADQLAMSFAAYNGGPGGLASDRRACAATTGCNPGIWFGHVERTSLKAKAAVPGYGKSFFDINREYVRNIMIARRARYLSLDA